MENFASTLGDASATCLINLTIVQMNGGSVAANVCQQYLEQYVFTVRKWTVQVLHTLLRDGNCSQPKVITNVQSKLLVSNVKTICNK